jgi:CBS domain containing-hemolysin-like protein
MREMYKTSEVKDIKADPLASAQVKPFPAAQPAPPAVSASRTNGESQRGFFARLFRRNKTDDTLREALEEFIEETGNAAPGDTTSIAGHERALMSNVLKLRGMTVVDVMIPRADVVAIEIGTSQAELLLLLAERQYSRIPVYRETLDDILGTIHIKDIMACLAQGRPVDIEDLVREAPIVSPAMPVLDLILMMKHMKKHMALVVDEYGGIDGLVTIGDVIEAIIGEVEDEHVTTEEPRMRLNRDGSLLADGRFSIEEFENRFGRILTEDEREDIDTLGGLVFELAGRVPARGEVITHISGMELEVVDADPRRVNKVLIRNIPTAAESPQT